MKSGKQGRFPKYTKPVDMAQNWRSRLLAEKRLNEAPAFVSSNPAILVLHKPLDPHSTLRGVRFLFGVPYRPPHRRKGNDIRDKLGAPKMCDLQLGGGDGLINPRR